MGSSRNCLANPFLALGRKNWLGRLAIADCCIWCIGPIWSCCHFNNSLSKKKRKQKPKFFNGKNVHNFYLANPFFPLGGLIPFEANSSTCFNTANSSASAARLEGVRHCYQPKESKVIPTCQNYLSNWHICIRTLGFASHILDELRAHWPWPLARDQASVARISHYSKNEIQVLSSWNHTVRNVGK